MYLGDLQSYAVHQDNLLLRLAIRAEFLAVQTKVLVLRAQVYFEQHHVVNALPPLIECMVLCQLLLLSAANEAEELDSAVLLEVLHLRCRQQSRAPHDEIRPAIALVLELLVIIALRVINIHTVVLGCLEDAHKRKAVGPEALHFRAVLVDCRVLYYARDERLHRVE